MCPHQKQEALGCPGMKIEPVSKTAAEKRIGSSTVLADPYLNSPWGDGIVAWGSGLHGMLGSMGIRKAQGVPVEFCIPVPVDRWATAPCMHELLPKGNRSEQGNTLHELPSWHADGQSFRAQEGLVRCGSSSRNREI